MRYEKRNTRYGSNVITAAVNQRALRKLAWLLFSAIAVMVCFVFAQATFAQEASGSADSVKKYNITFPISTLGNCASLEECKAYCEDIANKEACTNFAKSKGFYKEKPQGNARSKSVLEKAKTELGCTSEEACKEFCAKEENIQKCADFAKKYGIENAKKKVIDNTILEKAKAALGCTSEESCKALCKLEQNREKCSQFAKSAGLKGGMVKVASGSAGFNQVKQIMEKCAKDPKFCEQNASQIEKQLLGQGDQFCRQNPDKCKEMMRGLKDASRSGKPNPNEKAFDNANANARFCRENPEKCKNASGAGELRQKPSLKPELSPSEKPQVQGVQRTPSFFDWLVNVFLK